MLLLRMNPSCQHPKAEESKDNVSGRSSGQEQDSSAQFTRRAAPHVQRTPFCLCSMPDREQPLRQGPTYRWA